VAKARSPPARSACFPHPVRRKPPGRSVAAQEAPLEIYNDQKAFTICVWRVHSHANPRPRNRPVKIANARLRKYEF